MGLCCIEDWNGVLIDFKASLEVKFTNPLPSSLAAALVWRFRRLLSRWSCHHREQYPRINEMLSPH